MTRRRKAMTLAEHDAQLKSEGRYDEMRAAQRRAEDARQRHDSMWREAEAPLVEELRAAGLEVDSAWDLVNRREPYPEALPVLVEHLHRPYPDRVREGIARALAVPGDAKFAWESLATLYEREDQGTDTKAGLAVALAAVADDDVVQELIALARDPANGESRVLLLRGLARSRDPRGEAALDEFAEDDLLGTEARRILRRSQ
jgi:hypothetical protein